MLILISVKDGVIVECYCNDIATLATRCRCNDPAFINHCSSAKIELLANVLEFIFPKINTFKMTKRVEIELEAPESLASCCLQPFKSISIVRTLLS